MEPEPPSGIYVNAKMPNGSYATVDVLSLTEESFRRFILMRLENAGIVHGILPETAAADHVTLEADGELI